MKNSLAILSVVIVVSLGVWWLFFQVPTAVAPSTDNTNDTQGIDSAMPVPGSSGVIETEVINVDTSMTAQVVLTADGFSPKTVTIKKGGTITFVNESGSEMWVASAQHPTHTVYAGTTLQEHCDDTVDVSFDQCKVGNTYSFALDKVGSWKFHNHVNSSRFGTVVVE